MTRNRVSGFRVTVSKVRVRIRVSVRVRIRVTGFWVSVKAADTTCWTLRQQRGMPMTTWYDDSQGYPIKMHTPSP